MKSIVLFGAGNVATHLFRAISNTRNFRVVQVYNRTPANLVPFQTLVDTTSKMEEVKPADIYLIAVKDDAILPLVKELIFRQALVVHTAGAVSIDALENLDRKGIFYPLQTFSKTKKVDFKNIPICLEATNPQDLELLEELAGSISEKIFRINSEQRRSLHVAAVFVSNFVNYLYSEGEAICKENNIPFEILHPLILETAVKATGMSPLAAQTGPAKRNDTQVIQSHLELLTGDQQTIYSLITQSIQNLHGKEL
ncbi:DUF2520 domain-containing protein [Antarcticibacterium arcticum]|uniref:DUF2520 domain-containing protein n=1 Tax=Antarcticibacterium arcticum TaxID=2585771 RepID=A0A5B8YGW1_9FLAO|nr:Rossmann-like and DUF2520 domain-containing protein [Antarcticibacterium arcticum]QED36831.1 DUF2520 domain-containing protein [Antarcticibacterium arcticum]